LQPASNTFFRSLGGAFGTAIFGTIFSNRVAYFLAGWALQSWQVAMIHPHVEGFDSSATLDQLTTNTSGIITTLPEPVIQRNSSSWLCSNLPIGFPGSSASNISSDFLLGIFPERKNHYKAALHHHAARKELKQQVRR
jgi:hypothetical protein